jgi:hypothetical protein
VHMRRTMQTTWTLRVVRSCTAKIERQANRTKN